MSNTVKRPAASWRSETQEKYYNRLEWVFKKQKTVHADPNSFFIVGGLKFNLFYLKKFVLQPDVIGGCKLCVKKKKEAI